MPMTAMGRTPDLFSPFSKPGIESGTWTSLTGISEADQVSRLSKNNGAQDSGESQVDPSE